MLKDIVFKTMSFFLSSFLKAKSIVTKRYLMSEHITHIAVCEDIVHLANVMPTVEKSLKQSVAHYPDECQMGSAARGNHIFALPIIEKYRSHWNTPQWNEEAEIAYAFSVGWICHRAADLQMKPIYKVSKSDENPPASKKANRVYHDAVTLHEVYGDGKIPPLSPRIILSTATFEQDMRSLPATKGIDQPNLERLLNGLIQRSLLDQQDFLDDEKDIEKWIAQFLTKQQRLGDNLQWYIDAYQHPVAERTERYVTSMNYYNANDSIIKLARAAQQGNTIPTTEVTNALKTASTESQYAQALERGCRYLEYASQFFRKEIDQAKAEVVIEISMGGGE